MENRMAVAVLQASPIAGGRGPLREAEYVGGSEKVVSFGVQFSAEEVQALNFESWPGVLSLPYSPQAP